MLKIKLNIICSFTLILFLSVLPALANDGHGLWLEGKSKGEVTVVCKSVSPAVLLAKKELIDGWAGADGAEVKFLIKKDKSLKGDGFIINNNTIQSNNENGIIYGVFELLKRQKTGETTNYVISNPSYDIRILNHWDNLDGSIERGYAGRSIFWKGSGNLEVTESDRVLWREYARANASVGINASVLNNVNASPEMLSTGVLKRVTEIAKELRPYGIKVYMSINFSSPAGLGKLKTSDPLDKEVANWWKNKVKEIYGMIPDFGGFLVKANSEGLPGPQDFGRTHADGANMLADALKPYGGLVMWRAFVYSPNDKDRAKQAYNEFMPFDGMFRDNVIIQVKNGPIDFQPREPFSPLFGAMKKTAVMPELQITQEYLGHSHHLVYLGTMWEECLKSDTYQSGEGSTVAKCTDGSIYKHKLTAIAGVANIGLDRNWCGHIFAQSNWYSFARLAWNVDLSSKVVAEEWVKLTFSDSKNMKGWETDFLQPITKMMMESRETTVKYMMPFGLHHIFAGDHHYGPGPWYAPRGVRKDWTPPYYHNASDKGIGFDRTSTGSNAVEQYHKPLSDIYSNPATCPEELLLWFNFVPWDYKMKNGRNLWDAICIMYNDGVNEAREYQKVWAKARPYVDNERFDHVTGKLRKQVRDAQVWKDGCILYFKNFSKMDIPYEVEMPVWDLNYLMKTDMLDLNNN